MDLTKQKFIYVSSEMIDEKNQLQITGKTTGRKLNMFSTAESLSWPCNW